MPVRDGHNQSVTSYSIGGISTKQLSIVLIRGNHDQQSGDPWPELDIECMPDPTEAESWDLRHLPVESPPDLTWLDTCIQVID